MNLAQQDLIVNIRENFPVCKNLIYFDNAAVAPISKPVQSAIHRYLEYLTDYGGIHDYDVWNDKVENIRTRYAQFIGASDTEVAFVKNTSAGLSLAANGIPFKAGENVVVPAIEYPSNIYVWMHLERQGIEVRLVQPQNGCIPLEEMDKMIDEKTRAVSTSTVQFSTGFKADLKALSSMIQEKSRVYDRKIFFCVDAIQSLGAAHLNVKEYQIDFLSADGHKWLLAPEGCGIFYCNQDILDQITPAIVGWKSVKHPHQYLNIDFQLAESARKFEEGSHNLMGIMGLGASLELINKYSIEFIEKRICHLTDLLITGLQKHGFYITSPTQSSSKVGIVTFNTPHHDLKHLYKQLKQRGIELSLRGTSIRLSPHFYNSEEEIETFLTHLTEICH